jgi:hypothetical protein
MIRLLPVFLVAACLVQPLVSATTYTISSLIDVSQPDALFQFGYPGPGNIPVNSTSYFTGFAMGTPAVGQLNNGSFGFSTLNPLPGADGARLIGALKDGSAVGISYTLIPQPFPFQPLEVPTLVRWVNGVPTELPLASLGDPNAVFTPGFWALNGEGDLVGQYVLNGVTSLYRYNAITGEFEVIGLGVNDVAQVLPWGINDEGQILADVNGSTSLRRLYDPATGEWTTIDYPSGGFPSGVPFLNSAGQVALVLDVNGVSRVFEFKNGVLSPITPDGLPYQGPFLNVMGYNAQGLVIGSSNEKLGTFENGEFLTLFDRLTNPEGWADLTFFSGFLAGVNDSGQIFGLGNYQGQATAFVLNPNAGGEVPEPASAALVGVILLAAGVARKRFRS